MPTGAWLARALSASVGALQQPKSFSHEGDFKAALAKVLT
jgi:hypothetical protein